MAKKPLNFEAFREKTAILLSSVIKVIKPIYYLNTWGTQNGQDKIGNKAYKNIKKISRPGIYLFQSGPEDRAETS